MTESRADIGRYRLAQHPRMMPNFATLKNRYILQDCSPHRVIAFAEWLRIRAKRHKPLRGLKKLVRPSRDWLNQIYFHADG
jgi:hypothetical protein